MNPLRRHLVLSLLSGAGGCALQPVPPLDARAMDAPPMPPMPRPPALGQSWTYRRLNAYNSALLGTERDSVIALGPRVVIERRQPGRAEPLAQEHHAAWGRLLRDPAWELPQDFEQPVPLWPATLAGGETDSVNTRYRLDGSAFAYWVGVHCRARDWQRVRVPAGEFATLRVERLIRLEHPDISRLNPIRRDILWLAPELGRWVARETSGEYRIAGRGGGQAYEDRVRWELLSAD